MKICPKCNTEVEDSSKFCPKCNLNFESPEYLKEIQHYDVKHPDKNKEIIFNIIAVGQIFQMFILGLGMSINSMCFLSCPDEKMYSFSMTETYSNLNKYFQITALVIFILSIINIIFKKTNHALAIIAIVMDIIWIYLIFM